MQKVKVEGKFFDKYGNLKATSRQETSENPSTFNATLALLSDKLGVEVYYVNELGQTVFFDVQKQNRQKWELNHGRYLTNEGDYLKYLKQIKEAKWWQLPIIALNLHRWKKVAGWMGIDRSPNRFSHDESNGVVSTSYYFGHHENLSRVEVMTDQTWYRFYDVGIATIYAKKPAEYAYLRHLIGFWERKRCKNRDKDYRGKYHASGKQQAFIRLVGLRLKEEYVECTRLLPERYKWGEVFANYFPGNNHPINVLAEMLNRDWEEL